MPPLDADFLSQHLVRRMALELLDNKADRKWTGQHSTPQHFRKIVLVGGGLSTFSYKD